MFSVLWSWWNLCLANNIVNFPLPLLLLSCRRHFDVVSFSNPLKSNRMKIACITPTELAHESYIPSFLVVYGTLCLSYSGYTVVLNSVFAWSTKQIAESMCISLPTDRQNKCHKRNHVVHLTEQELPPEASVNFELKGNVTIISHLPLLRSSKLPS